MRSANVSNDVAGFSALLVERAKRRERQARHDSSLFMTNSFKFGGLKKHRFFHLCWLEPFGQCAATSAQAALLR
jgi:hypothetical protein